MWHQEEYVIFVLLLLIITNMQVTFSHDVSKVLGGQSFRWDVA